MGLSDTTAKTIKANIKKTPAEIDAAIISATTTSELQAQIHRDNLKATQDLTKKLNAIEEKNDCRTVKLLDHVANFMEWIAKKFSNGSVKVRKYTTKVNAPCGVSFKKAK